MNFCHNLIVILLVFFNFSANGQNKYVLDLKSEKWNLKKASFYFSDVLDERNDKRNVGKVLSGNKFIVAEFKNSAENDLKNLIDASFEKDTNATSIILSLDRFVLKETGSASNHKLILDFSIKFYRFLNDKRYLIYESTGKPEMNIQGNYANAPEKIILSSIKNVIIGFQNWINANTDFPLLAKNVRVVFVNENDERKNIKGDTIIWNENYRLKWSDFKGSSTLSSFMAQSNCIFSYRAEPKMKNGAMELHIRLNASFDRNHSWVIAGHQKDTLLAHEQLHFDICELNIRYLRKRILDLTLNPMEFDVQINSLFNEVWNEYQKQQQNYDDETGHGIISDKQLFWQTKIKEELTNTPSYLPSLIPEKTEH